MKRIATIFIVIASVSFVALWMWSHNKNREYLKEALGVSTLPASLQALHIQSDRFIDKFIRADFQINIADLSDILTKRPYSKTSDITILRRLPPRISKTIDFEPKDIYRWNGDLRNCLIFVDTTNSKIVAFYFDEFG